MPKLPLYKGSHNRTKHPFLPNKPKTESLTLASSQQISHTVEHLSYTYLTIIVLAMADISVIQQQVKISYTHSNTVLTAEPPFSIPPPVITWYKLTARGDTMPVCDLPRYYCSDSSLFISDIGVDDQGHYTSRAKNSLTMKELDYGTTIGNYPSHCHIRLTFF